MSLIIDERLSLLGIDGQSLVCSSLWNRCLVLDIPRSSWLISRNNHWFFHVDIEGKTTSSSSYGRWEQSNVLLYPYQYNTIIRNSYSVEDKLTFSVVYIRRFFITSRTRAAYASIRMSSNLRWQNNLSRACVSKERPITDFKANIEAMK